jgi:hypothetical protein
MSQYILLQSAVLFINVLFYAILQLKWMPKLKHVKILRELDHRLYNRHVYILMYKHIYL